MRNSTRSDNSRLVVTSSDGWAAHFRLLALTILLTLLLLSSVTKATTSSSDIRYTLSPVLTGTSWNSNLGLTDGVLYGGKLGIDFGRSIALEASYLTSSKLWTDFSRINLVDTSGFLVRDQRITVRRYGGDLLIRWPSDRFAPFGKIGGGIIRFEPANGKPVEKIEVRVGGGLD